MNIVAREMCNRNLLFDLVKSVCSFISSLFIRFVALHPH